MRAAGPGDPGLPWNPFKALVAPRPIGWISSLAPEGVVNLAPFSYFQAVADRPDIVMFSAASESVVLDDRVQPSYPRTNTEDNVLDRGEFVCNLVPWGLREHMNQTSVHLPRDRSEAEHVGL